jgi:hypothetical protein
VNPIDENVARIRRPRRRDGESRSARRIAMQARREQAREMGCNPQSGLR